MLPLLIYYYESAHEKPEKIFTTCLIIASYFILYWAHSRSSFIGLVLLGIFFYRKKILSQKIITQFATAGILVGIFFAIWGMDYLKNTEESKTASNSSRKALVLSSLLMIKDHPLGIGPERYDFASVPYKAQVGLPNHEKFRDRTPHSEPLRWALEHGVLYALALIAFVALLTLKTFFLPLGAKWKLAMGGFLLCLLPQILFQFPMQNAFPFLAAAFFLGLMLKKFPVLNTSISLGRPVWMLFSGLIFLAAVLFPTAATLEYFAAENLTMSKLACQLNRENWRACLNEGSILRNQRRYEEALKLFSKELHLRPHNFLAIKYAAVTQTELGNKEKACELSEIYATLMGKFGELQPVYDHLCKGTKTSSPVLRFIDAKNWEASFASWLNTTKAFQALNP